MVLKLYASKDLGISLTKVFDCIDSTDCIELIDFIVSIDFIDSNKPLDQWILLMLLIVWTTDMMYVFDDLFCICVLSLNVDTSKYLCSQN